MPQLILHHYSGSPFAEKICTILGYKGVAWRSVEIPPILPRPLLEPLTAPYRRTPVLQVGAHVYCDTRCIVSYLESAFPTPTLLPKGSGLSSALMARWAEPRIFVSMGPLRFRSASDVDGIFGGRVDASSFLRDRAPFMSGALDVGRASELVPAAWDQVKLFLATLESALSEGSPYLCGSTPSIADFSAYHLVWWLEHAPRIGDVLAETPCVPEWFGRMRSIGHGSVQAMSGEEALEEARRDSGRDARRLAVPGDAFSRDAGKRVRVASDDYGRDVVTGELFSSTRDEVVLIREQPDVGVLFLHFPRIGFQILPM
jgi:glutathione S-transferase